MAPADSPPPLPSNRSFGALFVVVFALLGGYSWWRGGSLHPWLFGTAGLLLVVSAVAPGLLAPFNRAWMKLGELLHRIVSPVVLGVIYYGLITPVGVAMRLAGRDELRRRFEPEASTYWVRREPPGPDPSGFPNQF